MGTSQTTYAIRTGIDICNPTRIEKAVERHGDIFLQRVYTEAEIAHCQIKANPYPSYAARFAVKEAVMKLLGEGIWEIPLKEIETISGDDKRPFLALAGKAKTLADKMGVCSIDISISHEQELAVASAVALIQDSR